MAYSTVQLTGTYKLPDGTPAQGTVEVIPSEKKIIDSAGNVILSGRVKVKLDELGHFTVDLPATDDISLNPTGFGYTVVAKLHHTHLPAVSFSLPTAVPVVDMADVESVDPSTFTPGVTYVTPEQLSLKANTADVDTALATKANTTDVNSALALKANASSLAAKADATRVDSLETLTNTGRLSDASLSATYALKGEVAGGAVDRVVSATVSGGTYTADLAVGDVFDLTLTGNATLAVTGLEAGRSFVVIITQDATGGSVLTLPTATGTVSLDTTASTYQELVYYSLDGTTLRVRQPGAGGPPPEAPAWSPSDMADKVAWFNAESLVAADATAVTTWADDYAVAGAATQATGTLQPTVQTVNGVRVVRFDGGDRLTTASFTTKAQPITIAALVKFAATTAEGVVYGGSTSEPAIYGSTNVIGSAGTTINSGVPASTTAFQTIVFTASGASSKVRVDGTEVSGSVGTAGMSIINLGTNSTGGAGLNGDIAEAIVVGHAVTGTELTELEAYLNAKKADLAS